MSSSFGDKINCTIFGQSHGEAIGIVMDGLPAGEQIDMDELALFLARRAPGQNEYSTKRREPDKPKFLSGIVDNVTCGAPLCAVIENSDVRSGDYAQLMDVPRPGHADYPAHIKYKGFNDIRGGGHFSGRLTAPMCIAGGILKQILRRRGIHIGAHIASIAGIHDARFDPVNVTERDFAAVAGKAFPVIDDNAGDLMKAAILNAKDSGDSVGGTIECCVIGVPAGTGEPMFGGIENVISTAVFAVPAVKGIEFGAGFAVSDMRGIENNDPYCFDASGAIKTTSNNHGGSLGGLATGMPIIFKTAHKPTPSISKEQDSVSISDQKNVKLSISGRHDPCIVPRSVPCIESAVAIAIANMISL